MELEEPAPAAAGNGAAAGRELVPGAGQPETWAGQPDGQADMKAEGAEERQLPSPAQIRAEKTLAAKMARAKKAAAKAACGKGTARATHIGKDWCLKYMDLAFKNMLLC